MKQNQQINAAKTMNMIPSINPDKMIFVIKLLQNVERGSQ